MNPSEVLEMIDTEFAQIRSLFEEKNDCYASDENALGNFDDQSYMTGQTPFQIWQVLANKHDLAIANAIKRDPKSPQDLSEGMTSRIRDKIVYSFLLLALLKRREYEHRQESNR